jgi:subtilase family serine protease
MNLSNGSFQGELVWEQTGGGLSFYEATPSYQARIAGLNGARGTPDISFDANPNTGVWVYDSIPLNGIGGPSSPWWIAGGTSVSSPSLAGIVNAAGHFYPSSTVELTDIYDLSLPGAFKDITSGACGRYDSNQAELGYDLCTGEGSPRGYKGK